MALYRGKNGEVDAVTFEEFVQHGREQINCPPDRMPSRFTYGWHLATLKDNDTTMRSSATFKNVETYIVIVDNGMIQFNRGEILVASAIGGLTTYTEESFHDLFDPV